MQNVWVKIWNQHVNEFENLVFVYVALSAFVTTVI
jgi:hypothetical protein